MPAVLTEDRAPVATRPTGDADAKGADHSHSTLSSNPRAPAVNPALRAGRSMASPPLSGSLRARAAYPLCRRGGAAGGDAPAPRLQAHRETGDERWREERVPGAPAIEELSNGLAPALLTLYRRTAARRSLTHPGRGSRIARARTAAAPPCYEGTVTRQPATEVLQARLPAVCVRRRPRGTVVRTPEVPGQELAFASHAVRLAGRMDLRGHAREPERRLPAEQGEDGAG